MVKAPKGSPALSTVATLLLVLAVSTGILWWALRGKSTDVAFASGQGYRLWAVTVAFAVAVWVWVARLGWSTVRRLALGRARWRVSLDIFAFGMVALVILLLVRFLQAGWEGLRVPVEGHPPLEFGLIIVGVVAAGPGIISVWLEHEHLSALAANIQRLTAEASLNVSTLVRQLQDAWIIIERCILALAALVSTAVLTTGALRAALVLAVLTDEQFPATDVLLYGAFFTMLLAVAVLPLITVWRNASKTLVDHGRRATRRHS